MNLKRGDYVQHPVHGVGIVSSVSPEGRYAVVRYGLSTKEYLRASPIHKLKEI